MDDDDQDQPDQSLRDRRQAQSAAGDLTRMGIDPRSLGLGNPEPRTPPPPAEPEEVVSPEARQPVLEVEPLTFAHLLPHARETRIRDAKIFHHAAHARLQR